MKKFTNYKKRLPAMKKLLLAGAFLALWCKGNAQTISCITIQQPCHNNGILAVSTTGLTPPIDFSYYDGTGGYFQHTGVLSVNDTLRNIGNAIIYVYANSSSIPMPVYTSATGMNVPFTVDAPVTTNAICPSLTGTAQITINGGTAPASVQWYNFNWAGTGSYVGTGNPMTLPAGEYSTIVTDAAGCMITSGTDSSAAIYIQNISGISFSVPTTDANCTNGTAMVTGISGGMAPYTYLWQNGATTSTLSGLSRGSCDVTVTDAQGCYQLGYGYISQAVTIGANPVATDATCLQNDGSVISFGSGGMPPYTYVYSNGMTGQTASGLAGGTNLNVTVTDANGCVGTEYTYINTTTPITVTYTTTASSCTAPTGTTNLSISGGTVPYTINWNTTPVLSGAALSGLAPGEYTFTVTDAVGCVRTGTVTIPPVSIIVASIAPSNPVCPAVTGTVNVFATGTTPPFTYSWNNGATTPAITSVPMGSYSCLITDAVGCSVTKYADVVATSPINIGFSSTQASCIYSADASILANATGGTAPYTYNWSNGQTGPNATSLTAGNYYVYVTDANGCTQNYYNNHAYVGYNPANDNCYCTITGKVYQDLNSNCVYDSGEPGIEHIMMHCNNFGYAFTDANGDYSFLVPSGTYTLSESVQYAYPLASCQSNAILVTVTAASSCVNTVNFANNMNTIHDMHILRTFVNNAIPGNTYTQGLIIQNDGTVPESAIQLGYRHDGQLTFTGTSPSVYSQLSPVAEPNWYSVTSGFPTMAAGSSTMLYSNNTVATNIPLNTLVNFYDTIAAAAPMNSWLSDFTPWNNVQHYQTTVIGSYDPNFKEVSPKGYGATGDITTADSVLDYVVHFQNTGSYYAQKVVVMDTLDADLDWNSLKPGYSDHPYTATMTENGVVKFTFDNINLDWKDRNDMDSRGLISYSIKQKAHLSPGTQIKNSAAIYFDYNAPVITNQTLNTIAVNASVAEMKTNNMISIYPNPATEEITIAMEHAENITAINIYDLQGRLVQTEAVNKNNTVQKVMIGNLMNGIYFIELKKTDGQKITGRFIKN
ncbi:MAG: hypothetical protein JWP12_956 [Bacteroidetes bacterium]|nr:hypothetical protein [Bacteroidota bacterium]